MPVRYLGFLRSAMAYSCMHHADILQTRVISIFRVSCGKVTSSNSTARSLCPALHGRCLLLDTLATRGLAEDPSYLDSPLDYYMLHVPMCRGTRIAASAVWPLPREWDLCWFQSTIMGMEFIGMAERVDRFQGRGAGRAGRIDASEGGKE
jgi:hypothetical protein